MRVPTDKPKALRAKTLGIQILAEAYPPLNKLDQNEQPKTLVSDIIKEPNNEAKI